MKICIVGAGAIGGFLGIRLANAGHQVTLLARGKHLQAIRTNGAKLIESDREIKVNLIASDDPEDFGPQDCLFITVKTPSLNEILPKLTPLLDDNTTVISAMNGIPWWFLQNLKGPLKGHLLNSIDPKNTLLKALPIERIIGCVVHAGSSVVEPGVIHHASGDLFIIGEPDGKIKERTLKIKESINQSNLNCKITENIHTEIWSKLVGNMGMGPISALTKLTLLGVANDPDARKISIAMMEEAISIGKELNLNIGMTADARVDIGAELGNFKPSILQDLEKGRPMEIDALIGVVAEIGKLINIPTPNIDIVLALQRAQARNLGLY